MIEIKKQENESVSSALRRFSRRVGQAGIITNAKNRRFRSRKPSPFKKKNQALRRIEKTKHYERLYKMGKLTSKKKKK